MPAPDLLRARARTAIEAGDWQAFERWVGHPRWRLAHGQAAPLLGAAMAAAQPVAWLERLAALGVDPTGGGLDKPSVHMAARRGDVDTVAWLLARGASPTTRSSYGMGISVAETALVEGHAEVVVALWRAHGSLWALARDSREPQHWVATAALPVLERLATQGWSAATAEPDPGSLEAPPQSFLGWARQRPDADPEVLAWLAAQSLDRRLAGAANPGTRARL